ncbi:MLO-like protein 4 isoform X2 [Tasmannia lanceolata]|uniref:MLO-like protein 4 isoform X2 n=1 Tax=Tasmannia lanceolata TaxID=3420 RepID=UPI00406297AE
MKVGKSLEETPTWSVATVITGLIALGFLFQRSIKRSERWLVRTRRKALLAALKKIKQELMLFGLLSLLLGHWTIWVAKICIKSSTLSARFYPCSKETYDLDEMFLKSMPVSSLYSLNQSAFGEPKKRSRYDFCPKGHEPFASYESLEQLHHLLIVLGIIHVSYSSLTVALAMLKIYSWRTWEFQVRSMAIQNLQGFDTRNVVIRGQSTFAFHHTSHPWSQNKVLIWALCFIRQFWSSINIADYMALRWGFITNHNLHPSYNFHNYMLRSMEEEFRDIVGISIPLWGYAIICVILNINGTNANFCLSFIPAILILLVGTKLHHIVVQLALEVVDTSPSTGNQLNPRDELFWFGKPKLLLWLIQLISFQNAFEMAIFIWSLWEIKEPSCFMKNRVFLVIRLTSGIIFQFWCSYNTFPLYVIITQMGSRFKKALIAESIRESLHRWHRRVKTKSRQDRSISSLATTTSTTSLDSMADEIGEISNASPSRTLNSSMTDERISALQESIMVESGEIYEQPHSDEALEVPNCSNPIFDNYNDDNDDDENDENDGKDASCLVLLPLEGA